MIERKVLAAAAVTAAIAAIYPVIQRLALLPIYVAGDGKSEGLAILNRLGSMLVLPGKYMVYRMWPPPEHTITTPQLFLAVFFNLIIYFILAALMLRGWHRLRRRREQTTVKDASSARARDLSDDFPASPQRRAFLASATTGVVGLTVFASGTYPVLVEPNWLSVRRVKVPIRALPESLTGLTIAQLTDLHHDEWISLDHIRDAIRLCNGLKPDLVALTGDYVTSNPALIKPAVHELARLRPRLGTLAVMGNHDWWSDVKETRNRFAEAGIPLIDNDRRFVSTGGDLVTKADSGLCIGGVGDLWEDEIALEKTFDKVPSDMPRILLSHNPDVAEDHRIASWYTKVDLMISGHTHGGQVRLPGIGTPIVPSAYGSKYVHGLVKGPGCAVQISAGVGLAMLPVRLNVRPEIVLMTLESA